jgi:hypothetical protein
MPYIPQNERLTYRTPCTPTTSGQLNYSITELLTWYIDAVYGKLTYAAINDVVGVLECTKLELYRRVAAPYENYKCLLNGDVYPLTLTKLDE